jgi:hypothetical protein
MIKNSILGVSFIIIAALVSRYILLNSATLPSYEKIFVINNELNITAKMICLRKIDKWYVATNLTDNSKVFTVAPNNKRSIIYER